MLKYISIMGCLGVAACAPPRQLQPVFPRYPEILRSANLTGNVHARVSINRKGGIDSIRVDSAGPAQALFRSAVVSSFQALRFSPARILGVPHSAELDYLIRFVLVRPVKPLQEDERLVTSDSLFATCPKPAAEFEIVVCRPAVPTRIRVLHQSSAALPFRESRLSKS
jgi:TonB family protein